MAFPGWSLLRNRVLGNIVGFGAGAAAADAFQPGLRPVQYEMESHFENRLLSPDDLAEAQQRGEISMAQGAAEAKNWGYDNTRFELLTKLHGTSLGPEEAVTALRRGYIGEERFRRAIAQGTVRVEWADVLEKLAREELSGAELASMVVQGVLSQDTGQQLALRVGVQPDSFDALVRLAGNPIAPEQALDLWNRGEIAETEVDVALVQSRLKPEWVDRFKKLARNIPSPSDMIRFAVREVYSPDIVRKFGQDQDFPAVFATQMKQHGFQGDEAKHYWAAHWDLPSPEQGFAMFHRGIIDQATLELLLRALDVMPYWRDRMVKLTYHVPGRIDLRRMYRFGVITQEELVRGYLDIGYSPEDAQRLAEFAVAEKMGAEKDLTKTEFLNVFKADVISRDDLLGHLKDLGYDEQESGWIADLAEAQKTTAYRNAVVAVVKKRYESHEIDEGVARERLSTAGVQSGAQDQLLELWDFERTTNLHPLSEAQARKIWKHDLKDVAWYKQQLLALGYSEANADLLVAVYS